jgi:hypothetical protein
MGFIKMRLIINTLFLILVFGCKGRGIRSYRVETKDSANFSVFISMLFPQERIFVKVNDEIVLDQIGDEIKGSPQSYLYFKYPSKIKKISVSGNYKGYITFERLYVDTLVNVSQRSLIISFPYPKGMTILNYKPYGFVPIKDANRNITLVDDAVYYKGTWRY